MMGDILAHDAERSFAIDVQAKDEIDYVEALKNGDSLIQWKPELLSPGRRFGAGESGQDIIRVEWGWDGMLSRRVTE